MPQRRRESRTPSDSLPSSLGHMGCYYLFARNGLGLPLMAKDLMMEWKAFPVRKRARKIWKTIPSSLFWEIWKERNIIVFENESFLSSRLKQSFINSLTTWASLIYEGEHSIVWLLLCIL